MAAAHSSSHYIRTIHTSFTAAHPGPWARANTVPLNMPIHYQPQPAQIQKYAQQPIIATPPASGAGGRRRAYAFRAPAASSGATPSSTKSSYKFDPFADEPTAPVPSLATLASLSAPPTPRLAPTPVPSQQLIQQGHYSLAPNQPRRQTRGYYAGGPQPPRTGYQQRPRTTVPSYSTYSEPSSAQAARYGPPTTEIWRAPSSSIPRGRSLTYEFEEYDYDSSSSSGGNGGLKSYSAPLPATTIREPVVQRQRTPSPPTVAAPRAPVSTQAANKFLNDKDAKAKLVAGILLNRVHAVGKPRRRIPSPVGGKKPYVPSSLSTVISCEA